MPDLSGRHPSKQTVGVDLRNRAHRGVPSVPLPSELFLRVLEGLERESPSSRNASCSRLPPMPARGRWKSCASSQQQRRTWNSARPLQICTHHQTSPFSVAERSKDGGAFYVPTAALLLTHLPRSWSGDDNTGVTNGLRDLSCTEWTQQTHTHTHKHTQTFEGGDAEFALSLTLSLSLFNTGGRKGLYSEDTSSGYIYLILAAALQKQGSWNTLVYEACVTTYAVYPTRTCASNTRVVGASRSH